MWCIPVSQGAIDLTAHERVRTRPRELAQLASVLSNFSQCADITSGSRVAAGPGVRPSVPVMAGGQNGWKPTGRLDPAPGKKSVPTVFDSVRVGDSERSNQADRRFRGRGSLRLTNPHPLLPVHAAGNGLAHQGVKIDEGSHSNAASRSPVDQLDRSFRGGPLNPDTLKP
jgi:hypothetical protein